MHAADAVHIVIWRHCRMQVKGRLALHPPCITVMHLDVLLMLCHLLI